MAKVNEPSEDRWHWSASAQQDDGDDGAGRAEVAPEPAPEPPGEVIHSERTRYFVITSNTMENVVKSVKHGLWATQRKNEAKFNEAFRQCPAVILVFSVNGTDTVQGYARMRSLIGQPANTSIDPFGGFGKLFSVEWLRLHDLPYREVSSLKNPFNGDRPVRDSRDGQELSNLCGRALCSIIDRHIDDPQSFQAAPQPATNRAADAPQQPRSESSGGRVTAATPNPVRQEPVLALMPPGPADSSESGPWTKRRKREKHYRNAPNPLTASFDEQLSYFLDLEYEEYIEWWQRRGTANPGPTAPPGSNIPAQLVGHAHPQVVQSPVSSPMSMPPYNHLPPHMGYYHGHRPPPVAAYPPFWQGA
mmetsp:Transcript_12611/g.28257  ORF Transcript_12611/g.28257 Transcript_12611/m.28257 type:complete len:361 (-) Transcript_12611:72-1154(-)